MRACFLPVSPPVLFGSVADTILAGIGLFVFIAGFVIRLDRGRFGEAVWWVAAFGGMLGWIALLRDAA